MNDREPVRVYLPGGVTPRPKNENKASDRNRRRKLRNKLK
jgi:hypothetical protein